MNEITKKVERKTVTLLNYSVCEAFQEAIGLTVPGKILEIIFVAVATVSNLRTQMTYAIRTENGRRGHASKHLKNQRNTRVLACFCTVFLSYLHSQGTRQNLLLKDPVGLPGGGSTPAQK